MALLFTSGCSFEVSYKDSHYACGPSQECPPGSICTSEGFCEVVDLSPHDAAAPLDGARADSTVLVADADPDTTPPMIDASLPPPLDDAATPDAATPDAAPPPMIDASLPPPPPDDAAPPDANVPPTTLSFVATRDTQLYSPEPTLNFGHWAEIQCAARTSPSVDSPVLFGFNVSAIPPGASVQSATLRLTVSSKALTAGQVNVFALLEDWVEGGQDGTPGVANYLQRKSGVSWSTPGAKPPSRGSSAVASFAPNQTFTSFDVPLPVSLVQGWIDDPVANDGVILTCPLGQEVTFYTRLGGSNAQHPRLTVSFVP